MATGPVVGIASGRNRDKIDEWLASDQVKSVLPRDLKLMWGVKAIPANELAQYYGVENTRESYYHLIAIRATGHDGRPPLEGDAITTAKERVSQRGSYEIEMSMNAEGAKTWARLTKANIGKSIAIVLDGFVYSYPTVQTEIRGGQSSITGNFTPEEAKDLATILNSGKMPAPARIIEDNVVGPSLGKEAVQSGLVSFIWAFVGVLLYMIFYYGFKAGAIVDVALMVNVFLLMGVLASFNAVLTMPGIAGIVLTLGMAVDANVLIYERIREELRSGKALKASIHDGYKNAFSAILDSNLTTFLTGLILFFFGTGPIKGFATTLMIGIATSFFSAVYITRLIYEWLMKKESFNVEFATGLTRNLFTKVNINFVQNRKIYFALSAIVLLVCVGSLATRGLKQGIDFTGGRTYVVRFEQEVDASKIYESMADAFAGANVEVKTYGSANQIRIATNYMVLDTEESGDKAVEEALYAGIKPFLPEGTASDEFSDKYLMSSQKIGPTVATDMRSKAGWAVALSMLGMFLYIMLRFRNWELSLGAVIGLMHDTLLIFGVFSLFYSVMPFAMEMDQSFIAAILTVIGYSINDNVVVYDRIREYRELYPKRKISEVFNTAMNSTIGRTVNTSLSTMVVLIVIFIFGSETIRGFVFAMTIGVVVGVYSTLCIASPISYLLLRRKAGGDVEISKVSTKLVG
jgi:SecD/SecF fusion protein